MTSPESPPRPSRLHAFRRLISDPPVAALIVVLALAAAWMVFTRPGQASTSSYNAAPSPRTGFAAPDFTLDTLAGDKLTLSELRAARDA